MRTPSKIPPSLIGRAFLTTQVPELSRRRMRAGDLQRPSRGVRAVRVDLDTVTGRCTSFSPRLHPGQAFSHITAAQLYRIPLPPYLENATTLHIAAEEESTCPPRVRGAIGHEIAGIAVRFRRYRGYLVTDPVSTWCHLASTLSLYDLIAAGDYLVSGRVLDEGREPPLSTMEELRAGIQRSAGQRGVRKMREAYGRIRTGVDSRTETWTRLVLVDGGLPEPVVNKPIFDADGHRLGKPDLSYLTERVLFEYDGDEHRVSKSRFRRDIARREFFESHQWRVVRVIPADIFTNPAAFVDRVRRILAQQSAAMLPRLQ